MLGFNQIHCFLLNLLEKYHTFLILFSCLQNDLPQIPKIPNTFQKREKSKWKAGKSFQPNYCQNSIGSRTELFNFPENFFPSVISELIVCKIMPNYTAIYIISPFCAFIPANYYYIISFLMIGNFLFILHALK